MHFFLAQFRINVYICRVIMKKVILSLLFVIGMITWVGCSDNSLENVQRQDLTESRKCAKCTVDPTFPTDSLNLVAPTTNQEARETSDPFVGYNEESRTYYFIPIVTFDVTKAGENPKLVLMEGTELEEWEQAVKNTEASVLYEGTEMLRGTCVAIRSYSSPSTGASLWYSTCGKFHIRCNGRWYAYTEDDFSYYGIFSSPSIAITTPCGTFTL